MNTLLVPHAMAGIGLPGVAASGTIAANTVVPVTKQWKVMEDLKRMNALQ